MIIREVGNVLRRKEFILYLESLYLIALFKDESLRCPAVTLERTVGIFDDKIFSFVRGRGHLVPASVMLLDHTLCSFERLCHDVI